MQVYISNILSVKNIAPLENSSIFLPFLPSLPASFLILLSYTIRDAFAEKASLIFVLIAGVAKHSAATVGVLQGATAGVEDGAEVACVTAGYH